LAENGKRLCESRDEEAFVEALIVLITAKRSWGESDLKMTGDQIREVARDRHKLGWCDTQIDRLKLKYITRPGKPAERFELLREIAKGHRKRGQAPGVPSEYAMTGLRLLVDPDPAAAGGTSLPGED
jgi:hypothetical protein